MNDKRDFDRAVDQWLDEGSDATPAEVIDAVLLAVRSTPQERDFRVPWRTTAMTSYLRVAAVIALAVIGSTAAIFTFGPGGSGFGGTSATPSPSPALLARGNFVTNVGEVVELEATREGSSVTGRMTVTAEGQNGPYAFTVDLQCARTTEDGLIMIGGVTTDSTGRNAPQEGTWAGIVLERGSPWERPPGISAASRRRPTAWRFSTSRISGNAARTRAGIGPTRSWEPSSLVRSVDQSMMPHNARAIAAAGRP